MTNSECFSILCISKRERGNGMKIEIEIKDEEKFCYDFLSCSPELLVMVHNFSEDSKECQEFILKSWPDKNIWEAAIRYINRKNKEQDSDYSTDIFKGIGYFIQKYSDKKSVRQCMI